MSPQLRYGAVWWLCLMLGLGCAPWRKQGHKGASPLKPPVASEDSVTLEIFTARFPEGDAESSEEDLWHYVDEQQLPTQLRRELLRNGIRAGVVSGQLPTSLARALRVSEVASPHPQKVPAIDADGKSVVHRRLLQLRCGRRGEILASGIHQQVHLLLYEAGEVHGRTYQMAQGVFGLHTALVGDGRVAVTLTPELHYGEARQQFTGQQGIWQMEYSRPKESFTRLALEASLAPGQMLLVTSLPDRAGSLGDCFFHHPDLGGCERKTIVIRLTQTPPPELYLDPALSNRL